MRTFLLSFALLAAAAVAQTATVTTPNPVSPQNVDRPFPGGVGRYQQWYSVGELAAALPTPMRIEQLEFFAGSSNSANATTIDMEVWMAHSNTGLSGTFASNFADPPVQVLPRTNIQLLAGPANSVVMTVPFVNRFTWDRVRNVVVDIRIFGNSRSNQPFSYNFRGTTAGIGTASRLYVAGNATATNGTPQASVGMVTRFTARPGSLMNFGAGCPGDGQVVPRNTSINIPFPGTVWNNQLTEAASQRLCMFVLGLSRTQTSSTPPIALPTDVGPLLGLGSTGCNLLVDPVATYWLQTVGGGAGSGVATLSLQMPAMTWYVGTSMFTQWFVLDPNSNNGMLSVSQGVWAIIAPVGG